jgi:fluoroquinolone transport system permease protein
MQFTQVIHKLSRNDVKLIGRDSFLLMLLGYIVSIAIVMRLAIPWLAEYLAIHAELPFALTDWYPMMVAFIAVFMGGVMAGMVFGFVLLDEKDDNTLKAMLVTPLPLNQYVAYRVGVPALLAFIIIVLEVLLMNLPGTILPLWQLVLIAAGGALTAPITTLLFATFAENKVQGFAMTKFTGTAGMLILLSWFVAEPAQLLFGLFPPFWVSKAYWLALENNPLWIGSLLPGIVLQLAVILLLVRRFQTAAYK